MAQEYSHKTCTLLADEFAGLGLLRPMLADRYEAGTELSFEVTGVLPAGRARVGLRIEKFVGGGFAGQVYRVEVISLCILHGRIKGLEVGGKYAIKILIPPSHGSLVFRNFIYALGFQGQFSLQVNPSAARAAALWQKFIRRAGELRFGTDQAVVDVLATFVDPTLGACGEISQWVEGRMWHFEVNDHLDHRKQWSRGLDEYAASAGSEEYRDKQRFMGEMVDLLHEIGAPELARQYEWSTCKSQPNCLKRLGADEGLTAVDFRAGLALLAILPMSPGDFKLIAKGLARGRLVQFDRGDTNKLQRFVEEHREHFVNTEQDMAPAMEELLAVEREYRDSLIDITHHHVRLLYDRKLWSRILNTAVTAWRVTNQTDESTSSSLARSPAMAGLFAATGLVKPLSICAIVVLACLWMFTPAGILSILPAAAIAIAALATSLLVRKLWGRADFRRHYAKILTSRRYFARAVSGKILEKLIGWHRAGRVGAEKTEKLARNKIWFFVHLPLSILPVFAHHILTDGHYARRLLYYIFIRPVRLFFNVQARRHWLLKMVADGKKHSTLTSEDAALIESQIDEPFIQQYLKSMAVHVCTLPITQVVSVAVAIWYVLANPELSWAQAWSKAGFIIVIFQFTPISPGSLARGLYTLYLVIRQRDFKNYNIAVFLSFFKYIGYLAFPIQMAHHYPALARFMAGHWATGAVHFIPVFGEHGALLEHGMFDLFYNHPLTVRRQMRRRAKNRQGLKPRQWHLVPCVLIVTLLAVLADAAFHHVADYLPRLRQIWWLVFWPAMFGGYLTARWAGGMGLARRIVAGTICGLTAGLAYTVCHWGLAGWISTGSIVPVIGHDVGLFLKSFLMRGVFFSTAAAIGAVVAETSGFKPDSSKI